MQAKTILTPSHRRHNTLTARLTAALLAVLANPANQPPLTLTEAFRRAIGGRR
jgi:hypothetical protein